MKKKETLEKKVLNVVEKIARKEITENLYSWPPHCMGIYHQPKRPKRK
ncbi:MULTISPECIES: cyclic lactone autoinducer peptide [Clostridia]|uniref:Cyclic lactone autoinducer peptide n=1 Tax=Lacrimispora xylanolytica TaxID=29375 RepID=A0ABY7AAA2_9FIRM|nr:MULTISPECIES: cyclic lactone autoinducer peptide [Clostridia]WAJ22799.1 cyclic lactone autoinducer peptide [Lacrimispora xylanolytica]